MTPRCPVRRRPFNSHCCWPDVLATLACLALFAGGCGKQATLRPGAARTPISQIRASANDGGVIIDTPAAEFLVTPTGYVKASLISAERKLSLDDPGGDPGITISAARKRLADVTFDVAHPQISESRGRLGTKGKRVEGSSKDVEAGLAESLVVEVYDDFPGIALVSASIRNTRDADVKLDAVELDRHRLNASLAGSAAAPNQMWSFHGASIEWGKDNVFEIPRKFSQKNQMGSLVEVKGDLGRVGGGIPVTAFWTRTVGEAIGHVETLPLVLSIPVETESDGHVDASVHLEPGSTLKPGDVYSTPQTFIAVYAGDY